MTVKLRLDVDYPYPSRAKSFAYLALGVKNKRSTDYLANARVIARMVNESPKQIMAYWFFSPYTIPDKRLLDLLNPNRHEIALHVANKPFEELRALENKTNRTIKYYTIHGTSRLLAQLLWRRKIGQTCAEVPRDFPLISFHNLGTMSLDTERYKLGLDNVVKSAGEWIEHDVVLSLHPEWLFKEGKKNRRGPFYDVLRIILDVDKEIDNLGIQKRAFIKIAHIIQEYEKNIFPTDEFTENLADRGIDIFTFLDPKWCCPISSPLNTWKKADDNVGLLEIKGYDSWWQSIGKKTRNMVRRAEKNGVNVTVVEPSEQLAEGIWKIYNETPIRQERAFSHFGESRQTVTGNMFASKNNTFIGAYLQDELVGFIQILYGDNIAIISNILALQRHWDKAINNALLAKAVEVCASKGVTRLMYGRVGNHPTLDRFKKNNGFLKSPITRYYVPLTNKGKLAIRLGLHRELKDSLPNFVKYPLIPAINWISRTKVRIKLRLKRLK